MNFYQTCLRILLVSTTLALTACGVFKDRSNDYLKAKSEPALKMPAGASNSQAKGYYAIPEMTSNTVKPISLVPPGLEEDINTLNAVDKAAKEEKIQAVENEKPEVTKPQQQYKYNPPLANAPAMANMGYEYQGKPFVSSTQTSTNNNTQTNSDDSDESQDQETTEQTKKKPKYDSPLVNGPTIMGKSY